MATHHAKKPSLPLASRDDKTTYVEVTRKKHKDEADIQAMLEEGVLKKGPASLFRECPSCGLYSHVGRKACPACEHQFPAKERKAKAKKSVLGPADYKRLSRSASKFRGYFDSEADAVQALSAAAHLLSLCGDSVEEAQSWIEDGEDDETD